MDKTDKILNMLSKPEPAMVVPIGSDVVIPNLSGIKGNKDAMNKLTLQTVTDNGATTTNTISILNGNKEIRLYAQNNTDYGRVYNNGATGGGVIINSGATYIQVANSVNVNTTSTVASAIFQVSSTAKGALLPVMTTAQKNAISGPAEGLIVYDTDLHKLCVRVAAAWETITSA